MDISHSYSNSTTSFLFYLVVASNLSYVDGSSTGAYTEVEVRAVSLSVVRVNSRKRIDLVAGYVSIVSGLNTGLVSCTDGGEDSIGLGNGILLCGLVGGVGTGVEKDESVLLSGDGSVVSGGNGSGKVSNAASVQTTGTVDGGSRGSSVGRGDSRNSGKDGSGSGDLSEGGTTVHVQGSGGTLEWEEKIIN